MGRYITKTIHYIFLIVLALAFSFPILVAVSNSFMSAFEITNRYTGYVTPANVFNANNNIHFVEMSLIPNFVTLKQYFKLFFGSPLFLGLFWNSVKIALPVVAGQMLISAPAAYAFAFSRFRYKEFIFFIYIVVMLMPLQVSLVPNYIMADTLNIDESYLAIILPGMFNPFGVFLLRQYLNGLPVEYIEAAKADGAGFIRIIISVIMPLLKSAVAALVILTFVEYWNVVDQAVIFIKDSTKEPLSVYLSRLSQENMDLIFAASCFYMLPTLLVFLFGQENMIEGIQLSGIK